MTTSSRYLSSCDALYRARIGMSSHLARHPPAPSTHTHQVTPSAGDGPSTVTYMQRQTPTATPRHTTQHIHTRTTGDRCEAPYMALGTLTKHPCSLKANRARPKACHRHPASTARTFRAIPAAIAAGPAPCGRCLAPSHASRISNFLHRVGFELNTSRWHSPQMSCSDLAVNRCVW